MDETVEEDVVEEIKEQVVEKSVPANARGESEFISEVRAKDKEDQIIKQQQQSLAEATEKAALTTIASASLKFNDVDSVMDNNNKEEFVSAPKSLDRLEEISKMRNEQRKMDEDDDDDVLKISDQDVELGSLDIHIIDKPTVKLDDSFLLNDVEILT
jgi:hypothetical protein